METKAQRDIIGEIRKIPHLSDAFQTPTLAWPTIIVFVISFAGFGLSAYALLTGLVSPFITIPLSGFFVFWSFTPLDEAVHRNLSNINWLNDLLGTMSAQLLLPGFTSALYRYLHVTHHARTGQPDDPDLKFTQGNILLCWLNAAFLDVLWVRFYIANWSELPVSERLRFVIGLTLYLGMFAAAFTSPYVVEFTLAFLLPMFIGRILTVHLFATIQHEKGHEQRHDQFGATWIQDVHSRWWERIFMLGQSQHLIHHLYPSSPWYQYDRILREAQKRIPNEAMRHGGYGARRQRAFSLDS